MRKKIGDGEKNRSFLKEQPASAESTISNQSRLPAEFKHINKRRKRN